MKRHWMLGVGALGLSLMAGSAWAQQSPQVAQPPQQGQGQPQAIDRKPGDIPGPIDSLEDLQDTGRMVFQLADENSDGQISQKEAVDAGNVLVGGFFFRADKDGNGVLSKDEATQAREAFLTSKPWLRYVIDTARSSKNQPGGNTNNNSQNQNMLASLAKTFDTNNDNQLQATELRSAVTTIVQSGFATADTNRDGQLSTTEVNAAIAGLARQVVQASFQQADKDNNGQISLQEFEQSIVEPARVAFKVMDLNHDGEISQQEAQSARRVIISKIRSMSLPEAPNSPRRLLNSAIGSQNQGGQPNQNPNAPR